MKERLEHSARVIDVKPGLLTVEVDAAGDECACCGLARVCNGSNGQRLTVRCDDGSAGRFSKGQLVRISTSGRSRLRAVVLLLVIPLVAMFGSALAVTACGGGDAAVALVSLAAVSLCFALLWVFRARIDGSVKWRVDTME